LPQDLHAYAEPAGKKRMIAPAAQAAAAEEQKARLFRPWRMIAPSRRLKLALNGNFNLKPDHAYAEDLRPFPRDIWQRLVDNCNKAAYPSYVRKGITLRHTNLRAMPTASPLYLNPRLPGEGFPFDYFQHSSLPMGMPLFICNISADGRWLLAETPLAAGWLPAGDVAEVDESFARRWQSPSLAALVSDNVVLAGSAESIGTLLPLAGAAPRGRGHALSVYCPVRGDDGKAAVSTVVLGPEDAVVVPLSLTPTEVARVGNEMMGQAYGWGGIARRRDCSALTRDVFTPFGIWLPRNSSRQAKAGGAVSLVGFGNEEKEAAILAKARPFLSLIWLPGHIGLYLGQYQGRPVMFHNMWGLRTRDADNTCNGRAVVGRAVVTSLRPGAERADICAPASIVDRIQRIVLLPGNGEDPAAAENADY
jgi:cell wall-associated NlpC family hydrolase